MPPITKRLDVGLFAADVVVIAANDLTKYHLADDINAVLFRRGIKELAAVARKLDASELRQFLIHAEPAPDDERTLRQAAFDTLLVEPPGGFSMASSHHTALSWARAVYLATAYAVDDEGTIKALARGNLPKVDADQALAAIDRVAVQCQAFAVVGDRQPLLDRMAAEEARATAAKRREWSAPRSRAGWCKVFRCANRTFRAWLADGKIPFKKIGDLVMLDTAEIPAAIGAVDADEIRQISADSG